MDGTILLRRARNNEGFFGSMFRANYRQKPHILCV